VGFPAITHGIQVRTGRFTEPSEPKPGNVDCLLITSAWTPGRSGHPIFFARPGRGYIQLGYPLRGPHQLPNVFPYADRLASCSDTARRLHQTGKKVATIDRVVRWRLVGVGSSPDNNWEFSVVKWLRQPAAERQGVLWFFIRGNPMKIEDKALLTEEWHVCTRKVESSQLAYVSIACAFAQRKRWSALPRNPKLLNLVYKLHDGDCTHLKLPR
jgi:hypothetical protein